MPELKQILVYADSLSWGLIPDTRNRLGFFQRWPGVLEKKLVEQGQYVRVLENCLNGRRTVWSDPFKAGRDGSEGLEQVIEMHSPLALVIVMLGTNDFQCTHDNNAWLSGQGMIKLLQIIRQAPIEPGMPVPPVAIVAPPVITWPKGDIAYKFHGAEKRCQGLARMLQQVAQEHQAYFFDANSVTESSPVDGIHLDAAQHEKLGCALAAWVLSTRLLNA